MTIYERIESLRKSRGLSQGRLEKQLNFSNGSISKWKNSTPKAERLQKLADFFGVSVDYIMTGKEEESKTLTNVFPVELKKFPALSKISCGVPKYTDENRESYVRSGTGIDADFCLTVKDDSMTGARILNGDTVFIKNQKIVENGEIAAVVVNGDSKATLKRFYYYKDRATLILKAENSNYDDLIFQNEELDQIYILGKAVVFQSDVI